MSEGSLGRGAAIRPDWLGRMAFDQALRLQEQIVASHPWAGDRLLLLEHDPVYTTGRSGPLEHLPGGGGAVPVRRIGRGGDATFHGPGQLVGYALVDLRARTVDLHRFLRALEQGVIEILGEYGLAGRRAPGCTGVWVGALPAHPAASHERTGDPGRKIAAIGIGVRRGISMHGFALNVSTDLDAFAAIVPCGIQGVVTTSLAAEGVRPVPTVAEVARSAARLVPRAIEAYLPGSSDPGTRA